MTQSARSMSRGQAWSFAAVIAAAIGIVLAIVPSLAADARKGMIVSAGDARLTIITVEDEVQTFPVAGEARITRDGQAARLDQLVKGDRATLTTELRDGVAVATVVEAESQR